MKDIKPSIIKKYQRQSKSIWKDQDDSTILLLANVANESTMELNYDRYIYLHRDNVGRWLGISLSRHIEEELGDGYGKYRDGTRMLEVLLNYLAEIRKFLIRFSDDMESVFGVDVETWLIACKARWRKRLYMNKAAT